MNMRIAVASLALLFSLTSVMAWETAPAGWATSSMPSTPSESQQRLNRAIATYGAEIGTLGMPSSTVYSTSSTLNVGNINNVTASNNSSVSVTQDVTDLKQTGTSTATVKAGTFNAGDIVGK